MRDNYIKYFYGSYKHAKQKGLSSEYLFYLKLKLLKDGELRVGTITKVIQEVSSYSPASISIYLKRLVEAGFLIPFVIKGKVVGYQVISYKRALRRIGVKTRFTGVSKNIAKEHRFQRLITNELIDNKIFKNFIEMMDVYQNSEKQLYKEKQKIKRKIKYQREKDDSITTRKTIRKLKEDLKSVQMMPGNRFKLSCRRLSRLLGYKSIQQGSLIERRAEDNGFLEIHRSFGVVEKKISFLEYLPMKALDDSLYWMFGNVVKNDCNILLFTSVFLGHFEDNKQSALTSLGQAKATAK